MAGFWTNVAIWLPISASLLVQAYKFFWEWYQVGEFDFQVLHRSGGMPSSHTAMITSLATTVGWIEGVSSTIFAFSVVISLIVIYDARGVRQESGKQARVLNQLVREFFRGEPIGEIKLKELVGHTPNQVLVGGIFGVSYTLLCLFFLNVAPHA
ncbi:MAG: divergent PAP2 family protein [Caldilineaceae bacterium]|nr:divergent PAP2 family protein [Caldilineaceae bacterium]